MQMQTVCLCYDGHELSVVAVPCDVFQPCQLLRLFFPIKVISHLEKNGGAAATVINMN